MQMNFGPVVGGEGQREQEKGNHTLEGGEYCCTMDSCKEQDALLLECG